MTLRAVPNDEPAHRELVRLPTEDAAAAHAALVVGELERLARMRKALLLSAEMQQAALEAQLAAAQETQDFIRWIDEQVSARVPQGCFRHVT